MIQDVVPLLSGRDLDELAQEKRCSLGDGSQLGDVFGLSLQAVDLNREDVSIRTCTDSLRLRELDQHPPSSYPQWCRC